jgi:hypothetical protein
MSVDADLQKLVGSRFTGTVPDSRRRAVAQQSAELPCRERHRGAAVDLAVRSLFREAVGHKQISLKFGQLAADSEFFNTKYTVVFTDGSMRWPAIVSLDLVVSCRVWQQLAGYASDRPMDAKR